ncbi:MAG: helix-turn-helix domain-containing protein [Beijerinckiaceae bacterium]|nr:helix-turn-helix domain-containing protein [Beijerinckiaceae bacterium]
MEASKDLDPLPDPASYEPLAQMPSRTLRKRGRPPGGQKPVPASGPGRAARKPRADSPPAQERAFLSVENVALRYDVSRATIWRWLKTRGFPKPRKIGRLTRWALADLEAFDQAMSNP